jgi:hypothetical protein
MRSAIKSNIPNFFLKLLNEVKCLPVSVREVLNFDFMCMNVVDGGLIVGISGDFSLQLAATISSILVGRPKNDANGWDF